VLWKKRVRGAGALTWKEKDDWKEELARLEVSIKKEIRGLNRKGGRGA